MLGTPRCDLKICWASRPWGFDSPSRHRLDQARDHRGWLAATGAGAEHSIIGKRHVSLLPAPPGLGRPVTMARPGGSCRRGLPPSLPHVDRGPRRSSTRPRVARRGADGSRAGQPEPAEVPGSSMLGAVGSSARRHPTPQGPSAEVVLDVMARSPVEASYESARSA
jgi:hypothetical protein